MTMRRILVLAAIFWLFMLPASAQGTDELYSASDFGADEFLDSIGESLPEEVQELLPADLFDPAAASETGLGFFAKAGLRLLNAALGPALRSFSTLMGLIVAASAIGALKGALKSEQLTAVFDFASGLCLMLAMYGTVVGLFELTESYLSALSGVMDSLLPVLTAVAAAGGNLSSAAVSSGGLLIGLDLIEKLASRGLMPVLQLCFGIAMASGMNGGLELSGVSKLIRGCFSWGLGLGAAAISAVMSFQTTIAAKADSLSMRAVRFAASSAVPVAGGIAADAVRTVAGSLSLVRSTVGWAGVVIIALMTLPPLLRVLLTRLGVVCAETAAGILGLNRERSILSEISGLLGMLTAVCVISALMLVYALAVFSNGAVALAA